ncbi:hypothetical protein E8E14_011096 [Neopestalotiopsis sp. 37M]|nr:hypothetical protein E8E14_011096 [Neopestalotiopsis sp. 37M]
MLFKGICWLLPVLVAGVTAAPHEKRSIQTGRRVLAYGENITGFAVYADTDGFAVIANPKNDNSELFEASWTVDTDGALAWNVSFSVPHNASANVTEDAASFYILPDADFAQSGFTVNGSIPDGAATEGFVLYGHDIMFSSGDSLQSKFWAQNTSNGYWNLVWNTEGSSKSDSVPVMLMTDDDDDDSSS